MARKVRLSYLNRQEVVKIYPWPWASGRTCVGQSAKSITRGLRGLHDSNAAEAGIWTQFRCYATTSLRLPRMKLSQPPSPQGRPGLPGDAAWAASTPGALAANYVQQQRQLLAELLPEQVGVRVA